MTSEKLKKELSLIDSAIVHSKTIINLKIALKEQRKVLFLCARSNIHLHIADQIKSIIGELEYNIHQLEENVSKILRKALKGKRIIIPEKFYFSGSDLKAGYVYVDELVTLTDNKTVRVSKYLLLSDCSKDILEFKSGDLLTEKQIDLLVDFIPSKLGNLEDIYKITLKSKCSIVEPIN
jgi:hypothetical protein